MSVYMADEDQLKELMKYISDHLQMPVLGFGGGAEFVVGDPWFHDVAIGTQIPGWLYADGSVYNIADYPQLAAHYASHHGASNFYGGDGVTTFAVPDLRGEFIRGAGTNSHENQGDGGAVGEHQDGTTFTVNSASGTSGNLWNASGDSITNRDARLDDVSGVGAYVKGTTISEISLFTSRPTNTSFPIYIKATVGHTYSTDERQVGTWIDGRVLYEKTITGTSGAVNTTSEVLIANNIDFAIIVKGGIKTSPDQDLKGDFMNDKEKVQMWVENNKLGVYTTNSAYASKPFYVVVQYTKTS